MKTPEFTSEWNVADRQTKKWIKSVDFAIHPVPEKGKLLEVENGRNGELFLNDEKFEEEPNNDDLEEEKFVETTEQALLPLVEKVKRNTTELSEMKSEMGSVENPLSKKDMQPIIDRLCILENEEMDKKQHLIERVETLYNRVQELCKKSRRYLRQEEIEVLHHWKLMKHATIKQMKKYLRERQKESFWIK